MMELTKFEEFVRTHPAECDVCGATGFLGLGFTKGSFHVSARCMHHVDGLEKVELYNLNQYRMIEILTRAAPGDLKWTPRLCKERSSHAAKSDIEWFKANPDRDVRARLPLGGDDHFGTAEQVLVRRMGIGFQRLAICGDAVSRDVVIPDDEEFIVRLFFMCHQAIDERATRSATAYYLCRFQLKGDFWSVGRLVLLDRVQMHF